MALHLLSLLALTTLLIFSGQADAARPRKLADSPKSSSAPQSSYSDDDGDVDDGGVSLDKILEKNGQFKTFLRLLDDTHVEDQIENQLKNNNDQGMTVFAPTDNAFNNLKPGTLNGLTEQEKVQLVLYHVIPKYYNLTTLQDVSNPLRSQATGQNGRLWGLNITSQNNQVNVSSGDVVTPVNNALTQEPPLMVFEISQVLLPGELFGSSKDSSVSSSPPSDSSASESGSPAGAPEGSGASRKELGLGLVVGVGVAGLVCLMAL